MKNSVTFIKENINILFEKFPQLKIRYEFRQSISTHLIEILPFNEFESNHEYILLEIEMENEFEILYGKNEEILFMSSDSLNEIRDEQYSVGYDEMIKTISIPPALKRVFTFEFETFESENSIKIEENTSYQLAA